MFSIPSLHLPFPLLSHCQHGAFPKTIAIWIKNTERCDQYKTYSIVYYTHNGKKVQDCVLGCDEGVVASREIGLSRQQQTVAPIFLAEFDNVFANDGSLSPPSGGRQLRVVLGSHGGKETYQEQSIALTRAKFCGSVSKIRPSARRYNTPKRSCLLLFVFLVRCYNRSEKQQCGLVDSVLSFIGAQAGGLKRETHNQIGMSLRIKLSFS